MFPLRVLPQRFPRLVADHPSWVALHATVVQGTCNKNGGQRDSFLVCGPATPREENHHGPCDESLPQDALPCQRPNWSGLYWSPFAEREAVHLSWVSQNIQRYYSTSFIGCAH